MVHACNRGERIIHRRGEGAQRDLDQLVDRAVDILAGSPLVAQNECAVDPGAEMFGYPVARPDHDQRLPGDDVVSG
ncbi:hypothetical protein D3C85_1418880 [compost metagenome]